MTANREVVVGLVSDTHGLLRPEVVDVRVLYVNPGSIGPRRFALPVAFARLHVRGGDVDARIEELSGLAGRRKNTP